MDNVQSNLEKCLIEHEGLKHYVYIDTMGISTIGIGRNVSSSGPGLSTDECLYLLRNDIYRCDHLLQSYTWYKALDHVRQEVLIEMVFNIGLAGLLQFKRTLSAIETKQYDQAADDILQSKWAKQVGSERACNIAKRLRTGQY